MPLIRPLIPLLCAAVVLLQSVPSLGAQPTTRSGFSYGQQVVAAVLMAEAWGEGEVAMTAVAEVIRSRSARAGVSPLAVVTRPRQFTCLNQTTPVALVRKFQGEEDFAIALRIARRIYHRPESLPGHARGATHFERVGTQAYWTRGHRPVATVGRLAFYRIP